MAEFKNSGYLFLSLQSLHHDGSFPIYFLSTRVCNTLGGWRYKLYLQSKQTILQPVGGSTSGEPAL